MDPLRRHPGRQHTAPTGTVGGMASQLGQMALDVAEGDALAGLVGEVKDVAGNQLEGLDSRARRGL